MEVVTCVVNVSFFSFPLIFFLQITKMPTSGMIKTRASETNCFNLKLRTGFGTFTFRVTPDDEGGFPLRNPPAANSLRFRRRELRDFD